jgi:hypothetical protein
MFDEEFNLSGSQYKKSPDPYTESHRGYNN